jgi:hypothetical protein
MQRLEHTNKVHLTQLQGWVVPQQRENKQTSKSTAALLAHSSFDGPDVPNNQRHPEVFFWPGSFWRPGAPRPKNHTFSRKSWLSGLDAEGGKTNTPLFSRICVVFFAFVPQVSKKHGGSGAPPKRWGLRPPPFGSPGPPRGRPDPQNR